MDKNETHINDSLYGGVSDKTRIVLMNPNSRAIYTTASYFLHFGFGTTRFPGWKILSKDGKFTDLISVSVHTGVNYINVIRASHGTVRLTDNRIVPIYRKREYMEIPAKDVQLYDCLIDVPLKNIIKEEDKLQEINLIDLMSIHSNISIVVTPKIATLLANIPRNASEEDRANLREKYLREGISLDAYKCIRSQLVDAIDENELYLIPKKTIGGVKPIPAKYKLTREFGRFYGLFYSEGYIDRSYICISNSDPEIIDFAKIYLAELLHREKVNINVHPNGCSHIRLSSMLFASLVRNNILGFHYGSGNLKLPNWFFFANDDFLKGFLSGVIDGDGCVDAQRSCTEICTSSATFAEDIQAICSRLGYIASMHVDRQKGKIAHFKDRTSIRRFDNYRVTIDNLDIVDMDLYDSIKARKLKGYTREHKYIRNKVYGNRVRSINKCNFNNCVYNFETNNHYFAAGTQLLHDCTNINSENIYTP